MFREWILTKIVNGERASYSAPKFARMQERTRSQMLEDIVANLANHAETGQIPKPYRQAILQFSENTSPKMLILSFRFRKFEKIYISLISHFCYLDVDPGDPLDT